jgi:hypothetical protein
MMILLSEVETMKKILLVGAEKAGKGLMLKLSPNAVESEKVFANE